MSDSLAILRFYAASSLILVLTLPLGWAFFQKSSRHVVLYTRVLGLLLVNFTVWLLSAIGVLGFSARGILVSLLLLAVIGAVLCRTRGTSVENVQAWWRRCWKTALFDEVVFFVALTCFAFFVGFFPQIFGTEKFMDFAFLNALMRGTDIPPHDPWFAGGTINYYYGGYMTMALLGRLSALPPAYTYNLSLAFLFASSFALCWAFGRQLSGSRKLGLLAPVTVALMGNLDGFLQVLQVGWPYRINYFQSSRVIVDGNNGGTINEFPFFSFYHADLHPHVMAIPFVLIFMIVLYELFLNFRVPSAATLPGLLGRLLMLSLCLGALGFINGLDLPTFGILLGGVLVFGSGRAFPKHRRGLLTGLLVAGALSFCAALMAYFAYYPFYGDFVAPGEEGGLLGWSIFRSDLGEFLTVFHLQLFLLVLYLLAHLAEISRRSHPQLFRLGLCGLAALFVFTFALFGYPVVALLSVLLLAAFYLIFASLRRPNDLFTAIMLALAAAILLGCEFVHVRDAYGENLQRMNTLFKFHYQAWILFGLSAPVVVLRVRRAGALPANLRTVLQVAVLALLAMNLVYPLGVSWERLRLKRRSLDGLGYYDSQQMAAHLATEWKMSPADAGTWLRGEGHAIAWLNQHVEGIPVVLEHPGTAAYKYDSRVSANTGLPTLVGWINHEQIWRRKWVNEDPESTRLLKEARLQSNVWSLMSYRQRIADRIYQDANFERIVPLIRQFNIEYIFIGALERAKYPAEGLDKFTPFCERVFREGNVTIYRVPEKYRAR